MILSLRIGALQSQRSIARRLVLAIGTPVATMLGASVVVFLAIHFVPGDPTETLLSSAGRSNPALVAQFRAAYGLDQPIWIQYVAWLGHVLTGDFGRSVVTNERVTDVVWTRLSATLLLGGVASVIALTAGIVFGMVASYARPRVGAALKTIPLIGLAFPSFAIGIALSFVFAVKLHLLPSSGMQSPTGTGDLGEILVHTILPALALSVYPAAFTARLVQGSMEEVEEQDFVRTAKSLGIPGWRITVQHVFPNAVLPVITNGAVLIGYMLTAAVFVEQVFNWPGIGSMMVNAVLTRDYPLLEAGALVVALTYVLLSLAVDFLYGRVDPRVKVRQRQLA
jgi:peptide/nickel transport system permease protein